MVGGGEGAFIGAVHRIAARLDDHYELVAGALSSTPRRRRGRARRSASRPIAPMRDFDEMAQGRGRDARTASRRSRSSRRTICTRPSRSAFLEAGIHVICDKPLTATLAEAKALAAAVSRTGRIFALTHNYTGYPMVRQAREMVAAASSASCASSRSNMRRTG